VNTRRLSSREIDHYASRGFTHTRVVVGELHVSLADLDGVIGGHDTASPQLLVVVRGRVEVATRTERAELGVGEAVAWQEGEWHETRSLEPSTLLIVEGAFE
jgi:mannose-6-phosphate isomerase-like protein (cupin superfamily)